MNTGMPGLIPLRSLDVLEPDLKMDGVIYDGGGVYLMLGECIVDGKTYYATGHLFITPYGLGEEHDFKVWDAASNEEVDEWHDARATFHMRTILEYEDDE